MKIRSVFLTSCALLITVRLASAAMQGDAGSRPTVTLDAQSSSAESPFSVPEGYELQILEPIGAKIARPKDWFFSEFIDPVGYTWIISREPLGKGDYKTGLRIQLLHGMEKNKKISADDFIKNFIDEKKRGGAKVISECGGKNFGSVHRKCIETEEEIEIAGEKGKYHISYSAFWYDEIDTAILLTFGAPASEWDSASAFLAKIGHFEMPDFPAMMKSAASDRNDGECLPAIKHPDALKIRQYAAAAGDGKEEFFTIGALGNSRFLLDGVNLHVMSAQKLSDEIKSDAEKFSHKTKIILNWPYSRAGDAIFAKELQKLTGKEVSGSSGPFWRYPDGSGATTDPSLGLQWPNANNIIECFIGDGTIITGNECKKIAKGLDHSKAIFSNSMFALDSCSDLSKKSLNALLGDRRDAFILYIYYSFVLNAPEKAMGFLSLAAAGRDPLGEYFMAQELKDKDPSASRKFLESAAADGDRQAAEELK